MASLFLRFLSKFFVKLGLKNPPSINILLLIWIEDITQSNGSRKASVHGLIKRMLRQKHIKDRISDNFNKCDINLRRQYIDITKYTPDIFRQLVYKFNKVVFIMDVEKDLNSDDAKKQLLKFYNSEYYKNIPLLILGIKNSSSIISFDILFKYFENTGLMNGSNSVKLLVCNLNATDILSVLEYILEQHFADINTYY
jgi:hypothetical protein